MSYQLKFMDTKITLSFDEEVILKAKHFAEENNISLSRLVELVLGRIVSKKYKTLEDFPVSEWVHLVSEGPAEYKTSKQTRKKFKERFYKSKK